LLSIFERIDLQIEDSIMPLKNKPKLIIKFLIEFAIFIADFGLKANLFGNTKERKMN